MSESSWLVPPPSGEAGRTALVLLPYAGGGARAYAPLLPHLPAWIEPLHVLLPGRERRFREAPLRSMEQAVEELSTHVAPRIPERFALLGHSMGALLACELALGLEQLGRTARCLFVSGSRPPQASEGTQPLHTLGDEALRGRILAMGGTPEEVLASEELMELVLPALRADLELGETWRRSDPPQLACPVVAFAADDDPRGDSAALAGWRDTTRAGFELRSFAGGHFYFLEHAPALAAEIAARLLSGSTGP